MFTFTAMIFAQMITLYRKDRGISLRRLGRALGIGWQTLYKIEKGHSPTGRNMIKLLLWALDEEKPL